MKKISNIYGISFLRTENSTLNVFNFLNVFIFSGDGAVFVRWGRNICPESSTLVYNGIIALYKYTHILTKTTFHLHCHFMTFNYLYFAVRAPHAVLMPVCQGSYNVPILLVKKGHNAKNIHFRVMPLALYLVMMSRYSNFGVDNFKFILFE